MQTTSTPYRLAYEQAHSLYAQPRVIVEWNHNRYSKTVTVTNSDGPTDDQFKDTFPISSIAYTLRGTTGLSKARVGEARTYNMRRNDAPQWRTFGPRTNYKYYSSFHQTDGAGNMVNLRPQVNYSEPRMTNKIVVGLEVSWANVDQWHLDVFMDGDWTQIANHTTASVDSLGRIVVYLQPGGNAWGPAVARENPVAITAVRFRPIHMTKGNAHFNMIELSARLERDLSEDVVSVDTSRTTEEHSQILPIGIITSNTATVVLDNTREDFDPDNTASPYYGLLDANAEVRIELGTDVSQFGGGMEWVRQGTYYVDSWETDLEESTTTLTCTDASKFLQSMLMNPVLFIDRTPGQIVAEILSSVGIRNYSIDISDSEKQGRIPFVWFTDEDNVWEALKSICQSTQGTVYTDERGVFHYVSRDKAYANSNQEAKYRITAVNEGSRLANLIDLSENFEVEANKVTVAYKPYVANSRKVPVDKVIVEENEIGQAKRVNRRVYDSVPIDSVLWKPEDTVTLRASELLESMTASQTHLRIPEADAQTWPWAAHVNIEGEVMSYEGKEYRYWKDRREVKKTVTSQEQQEQIDDLESDSGTAHKNGYTGRIFGVKRGLRDTKAAAHTRDLAGWSHWIKRGNGQVDPAPRRATNLGSEMVLWGQSVDDYGTYLHSERGGFGDRYRVYGTRMRFANTAYTGGTAGLVWRLQSDRTQGYYVEINLSNYVTKVHKGNISEVRVYKMLPDGNRLALPNATANARGIAMPVVKNQWIDIEIVDQWESGTVSVHINGRKVHTFKDPGANLGPGNWGPFVRGHTVAAFEYFYVVNTVADTTPDIDATSFRNKINGGYVSGFADREISRKSKNYVNWYFDDFGPWVHEMREFNVKFDKVPALDAHVYMSNDWDAYIVEGNRTPFDAKFWIANAGRDNAVINGDDPTVFIGGGEIKQQMLVYGQLITADSEEKTGNIVTNEEEENEVTVSNEFSIRKRGVTELTYDTNWIQSESQAKAVADWVTAHWSEPVDNITVQGFFNPALQLGDLVELHHPDRSILASNHRYHVVGLNIGFETGITTSLTLRRVRNVQPSS